MAEVRSNNTSFCLTKVRIFRSRIYLIWNYSSGALSSAFEINDQIIDVEKFREKNGIRCSGESVPDPIASFTACRLPPDLEKRIVNLNFLSPTPIQSQSLPVILSYRDMVAIASSGSGKTLCFVLPAIVSDY